MVVLHISKCARYLFDNEIPRRIVDPDRIVTSSEQPLRPYRIQDIASLLYLGLHVFSEDEAGFAERGLVDEEHVIEGEVLDVLLSVQNKILDIFQEKAVGVIALHIEHRSFLKDYIGKDPHRLAGRLDVNTIFLGCRHVVFCRMKGTGQEEGRNDRNCGISTHCSQ